MNNQAFEKPRVPKRFYFLTAMVFAPVFFCLAVIGARWYGFLAIAAGFGLLMWIRHTPAWRGFTIPLCFAISLLVAVAGLYFSRPRHDVSLSGQIGGGVVRVFMRLPVDETVRKGEVFSDASVYKPSEGHTYNVIKLPNSRLEVLTKVGSTSKYAVLQLHGGAFEAGMNDLYRTIAERYCALTGGATVYTLDYRLYPAYAYPAQQEDAMDAWSYLTKTLGIAPDHILVAGDSAGGNLVLSLSLRLRDAGEKLPVALICMSPWADLSNSGISHVKNATLDPTFGVNEADYDGYTHVGVQSTYANGLDVQGPYISPSFGDYHGFPPMLLQASEIEVLLSDSEMVQKNAVKNGVDCTLSVYPGMFHVFQGSLDLLPESREAWQEVGEFIKRVLTE